VCAGRTYYINNIFIMIIINIDRIWECLLFFRTGSHKFRGRTFWKSIFLPRDAMRKRDRCYRVSTGVCPSVCLSVTFVYCIQTAKDAVKLPSRPGSPTYWLFDRKRRCPIPRETHSLSGGAKYMGWGKNCDFRLKLPFISETAWHRPMVAMER